MVFNVNLFKSFRLNWRTPKAVFQVLDAEFDFDFDPCPSDPSFDGLVVDWGERSFVNPPYGREIVKWVDKAVDEYGRGKLVVMLVASRTDTRWWHKLMREACEIRFIKGRLKFDDQANSAPFPSAIIILKPKLYGRLMP